MTHTLSLLIGGLVLFLYAITKFSAVMEHVFSERAKSTIEKYTRNIFISILIGTITTILLDSSSAVIILTIVFINAKTLTFRQAIGIILGANIGTTFSSQIIAMDVGQYSVYLLIIGLGISIFTQKEAFRRTGQILLYFGMLFFGLFLMEESVVPLKESELFTSWIAAIEDNAVQGAFIGGLVTLIIQSSSATVGLAIMLGKQQILSIAGGIAIMLGAELGTCSDTLLATINGTRQALKAGLFHFTFNLLTIIIGLILFTPFVQLIKSLSLGAGIDQTIANAHLMFNVLGVVAVLPFVNALESMLNTLVPEKKPGLALASETGN